MAIITSTMLNSFREAIESAGLTPPDEIVPDGEWHRFASNGDCDDDAGWYRLHEDGIPAGSFGCFRLGITQTWCAKAEQKLTPQERAEHRTRITAIQLQRDDEERQRHAEAAHRAQQIWAAAKPAPDDHPYLMRKGVEPHGLRIDTDGRLIVPIYREGLLTTLEYIAADGDKKYLRGGRKQGGSFTFGDREHARTLLLGEGYATTASLYEATGLPVVMAFDAGNLPAVATMLRQHHPDATILVCGDNDFHDDGKENTGVLKATAAANAIGGFLAIPEPINRTKTDWNDVHRQRGLEAVRQQITAVVDGEASLASASVGDGLADHEPWPELDLAALYGLAGDVVRLLAPHTEADPVALLTTLLSEYGCSIGRASHILLDGGRHPLLFWPLLIGRSSKSRKGSSERRVNHMFQLADPLWTRGECRGTLSSGEGLVQAVRDPTYKEELDRPTNDLQKRCMDSGIADKRLFLVQSEFGCVLRIMHREGNSLSGVLRDAWDGLDLCPMTKTATIRATHPHVAIVGHTTVDELRKNLTDIEMSNGFGNRFCFFVVKRAQELADYSEPNRAETEAVVTRLKAALTHGRTADRLSMTPAAREEWRAIYHDLSADRPGVVGALLGRAEAQVQRLAALYCLLDRQCQIDTPHLHAALALWQYAEDSTAFLFGQSTGDTDADNILAALRQAESMTDTEISQLFGNNRLRTRLDHAKEILRRAGLATHDLRKTGGRPVRVWRATRRRA